MEIVDRSEDVRKDISEGKRLAKIEALLKESFLPCHFFKSELSIIVGHSEENVAVFSTMMHSPGKMRLYDKSFEATAIKFGEEYEKRGLNKSADSPPAFKDGPFILEKYYI
ncbi:MAG: hypothetical protein ABIH28_03745 [archaeon]